MTAPNKTSDLPATLRAPTDDGSARHLKGLTLPDLELPSTANRRVNLSRITAPWTVIYCYPKTGQPGKPQPPGWDDIPGARGCTAETCSFRDHHRGLAKLSANVFGVSTQSTAYQQEMVRRLRVPYEVLSDQDLAFTRALRLPTFTAEGTILMKRLTMIARRDRIEKVFFPVFPPDNHAQEVIAWLRRYGASVDAPVRE